MINSRRRQRDVTHTDLDGRGRTRCDIPDVQSADPSREEEIYGGGVTRDGGPLQEKEIETQE